MTQGQSLIFIIRFFAVALAVISVGCGGGSGSSGTTPSKTASTTVIINADPGTIVAVRVGETAVLDGSSSNASTTQALSFAWSFTSIPDASNTQLENATTANPSFVADARGTYMVQLVVSAEGASSQRAIAFVEVTDVNIDGSRITGIKVHTKYSAICADCHDGRFDGWDENGQYDEQAVVQFKASDHLATSNMCEACHTTFGFELPRYTDHLEVFGNCSVCHDGVLAIGKSDRHVETTAECDDCHNTSSFILLGPDGSFDHTDINKYCDTCHNGIVATGKYDGHISTTGDCSLCHITDNFQTVSFNHYNIVDGCISCHDDVTAVGKNQALNHPATSDNCEVCHNTDTFYLGGVFNHNVIDEETQPCASCHDGNHVAAGARGITVTAIHTNANNGGVDCGACHNTRDFFPAYIDHATNILVTGNRCDSCHNDSPDSAVGKPSPNHMPTNDDCGVCHTPGNFATGQFDHDPAVVGPVTCDTCHDDVVMSGKPFTHIPTTEDCRVCHGTDTFSNVVVDHSNIIDGCVACHDSVIATGKPSQTHLPTDDDCSSCHAVSAFSPSISFDHSGVTGNCQDCHNGQFTTPTETLKGKAVNHIPTQDDCVSCHNTSDFTGATFDHSNTTRGCEGCHNGRFTTTACSIKGKFVDCIINGISVDIDHIPTDQDCYLCHTVNTFTSSSFTHVGISGNCMSCHDGTRDATGALGKTSDHPTTTADCGVCHSTADAPGTNAPSFTIHFVDHTTLIDSCGRSDCHDSSSTAGIFAASNAHGPTNGNDCELCHVPGGTWVPAVFDHSNLSSNPQCDSCHGVNATGKDAKTNPAHINTSEDCDVCHNTTAFAGATFDHQGIVNNCASCHNGNTATGKPSTHVPTNGDCVECHQTTGFIPGTFDHVGIVDNCQSCHDGVFATGKVDAVNHVSTNQDCGVCHNTTGFIPATFDHSGITNNCARSGCHGSGATGKNNGHLSTSLDCSACHTTATFVGGTWFHDSSTANNCLSCHSPGNGATPQPNQGHFDTGGGVQCDACHTTNGWGDQGTFDHCPNTNANNNRCGDYPGDHRIGKTACIDCHKNNSATPVSYPNQNQYKPFCAGCHAGDFRREGDHIGGNNGTVAQNKNCGASGCHRVNSNGF